MAGLELNRGGGCPPEEESKEAFEARVEAAAEQRVANERCYQRQRIDRALGTPEELERREGEALFTAAQLRRPGAAGMGVDQRFDARACEANAEFFRLQARRARQGVSQKSPTP